MNGIDFAYLPIIGRGEQINIICAMHGIKVNTMMTKPMGDDFDKDVQSPFGTIPWFRDNSNGIELNDSLAIVQYLVSKYKGPLTPKSHENAALTAMYWAWAQDYYSFVLSPLHDIITDNSDPFWRNLRLTNTLADGGKEVGISNLTILHQKRVQYLENYLTKMNLGNFVTGENCSYADIFIYTCVKTVQETGGFGILRESCDGVPFKDCTNILKICKSVGEIPEVIECVGSKFQEYPI